MKGSNGNPPTVELRIGGAIVREDTTGRAIETLAAYIDVLPTLAELCGISVPEGYDPDGLSLRPLLEGEKDEWPRAHLIEQYIGGAYFTEVECLDLAE